MMGQQPRTEPLFYDFRLEDQTRDDHLLKRLDRSMDFRFVRERLRDAYSSMGRPSIEPEILLRMLLVACRSEFVTADTAGGVRVFPLDRPSIGGVSVDVASEFAS
jgi:transposase